MHWPGLRLRWLAAAPILVATLAVQWKVAHPAPTFRAVAVVTLRAPEVESAADARPNPYSDPRRSLAATAAVIAQGMESSSAAAQLRTQGVIGTYSLDPRNSGTVQEPYFSLPRIDVSVVAGDPVTAVHSLTTLVTALGDDLTGLQGQVGVYPNDRITVNYLVMPSVGRIFGSKVRALFAVTVIGWGAAFLVPRWIGEAASRRAPSQRTASRRPPKRVRQLP